VNELSARFRASQWWLLPAVVLVLVIGWEIDWGNAVHTPPPAAEAIAPKPVAMGLLPEFEIAGGIAAHSETVNRPLFNPTRRPAPVAVVESAKPRMEKGLYTLTGTTVTGDLSLAFLKETKGGKARTVKQGDSINGILVSDVKPDRVKLTMGDDSEELVLKVVTNPKPTPQPAAPAPAAGARRGAGAISPAMQRPPNSPAQSAAQTLAERRRAARAAEAAAAAGGAPVGVPGTAPVPAPPNPAQAGTTGAPAADSGWAQVYQRYQQRRQRQ